MNAEQFQDFCEQAMMELEAKQHDLQKNFQLAKWPRWWLDQKNELLQFIDSQGNVVVEADTINIGSYAPASQTWMWAWSNPSVTPEVKEKSNRLQELHQITGFRVFAYSNTFEIDEFMAWELAAIAAQHLGAEGIYRAADGNSPHILLALKNVRKKTALH